VTLLAPCYGSPVSHGALDESPILRSYSSRNLYCELIRRLCREDILVFVLERSDQPIVPKRVSQEPHTQIHCTPQPAHQLASSPPQKNDFNRAPRRGPAPGQSPPRVPLLSELLSKARAAAAGAPPVLSEIGPRKGMGCLLRGVVTTEMAHVAIHRDSSRVIPAPAIPAHASVACPPIEYSPPIEADISSYGLLGDEVQGLCRRACWERRGMLP
jgi:hypothetical protein